MKSLVIDSVDPALNLALEEHLFAELKADDPGWFLLWRNSPTIVVGRNQNTLAEVNSTFVDKYDLNVIRRSTGGGAVYHDLGNLNFSFIHNSQAEGKIDFKNYLKPILETLEYMGVKAEFSGRNDLLISGKKFSGSAQLRNGKKVLHHGTILVDLDIDMLEAALNCAPDKYQSKGIASVRSRVTNLSDIWASTSTMDDLIENLLKKCASEAGQLYDNSIQEAEKLAQKKYRTWDWNYGKSPAFNERLSHRFPWGAVECCFEVKRGIIKNCYISGDYFSTVETQVIMDALTDVKHNPESILAALEDIPLEACFAGCIPHEVAQFLAGK